MQRNVVLTTIISLAAIFGFLFLVYSFSNQSAEKPAQVYQETAKIQTDDHISWSPAKKTVLVEYADHQCPGCKSFHTILQSLEKVPNIGKKITLVFRHFPLSMHKNAVPAARAAEAAGNQGKFWEMSDLLFKNQESWGALGNPTDYFVKLAQQLKLDAGKFMIWDGTRSEFDEFYESQASFNNYVLNVNFSLPFYRKNFVIK